MLLRACLREPDGPAAWTALNRRLRPRGTANLLAANRRLVALLQHAGARDPRGFALPPELRRRLSAVALRERLRSSVFRRSAHEAVRTLRARGWDVMVLRGAALAELAYPAPHLRHCHDLDVLVRRAGEHDDGDFRLDGVAAGASLHSSAFLHPRAQGYDGDLWARSGPIDLGGQGARVMAPADLLVHICGHAFYSESRENLSWATDAWFTLASWPALDWASVVRIAEERHLSPALALLLGYLRRNLGAPVPADALRALDALAMEPVDRDIALAMAWSAARRRAPSRTKAVLSAGAGAPLLVQWRLMSSPTSRQAVLGRRG